MSFSLYFFLLTAFYLSNLCVSHKDTLLKCYICMELDNTIKQKCDENRPMYQTCVFTSDLVNWAHVKTKLDFEVTFKCLWAFYKVRDSSEIKSLRGCVAEYNEYLACDHLSEIIPIHEEISCDVCDTNNCNNVFDPPKDKASNNECFVLFLVVLLIFSFYQIINSF